MDWHYIRWVKLVDYDQCHRVYTYNFENDFDEGPDDSPLPRHEEPPLLLPFIPPCLLHLSFSSMWMYASWSSLSQICYLS